MNANKPDNLLDPKIWNRLSDREKSEAARVLDWQTKQEKKKLRGLDAVEEIWR